MIMHSPLCNAADLPGGLRGQLPEPGCNPSRAARIDEPLPRHRHPSARSRVTNQTRNFTRDPRERLLVCDCATVDRCAPARQRPNRYMLSATERHGY
jgi:hypothetical protein